METFKPLAPVNEAPLRNCSNCVHAYTESIPQQLIRQLVCHRYPPQLLTVPAPGGYRMVTMSPFVQPQQFCHSHDAKPVGDEPVPVS